MGPDEIHLASFPFGGSAGMKLRPVLLLTGPSGSARIGEDTRVTTASPLARYNVVWLAPFIRYVPCDRIEAWTRA